MTGIVTMIAIATGIEIVIAACTATTIMTGTIADIMIAMIAAGPAATTGGETGTTAGGHHDDRWRYRNRGRDWDHDGDRR